MYVIPHRHAGVRQVRQVVERRHRNAGVVNHSAACILPGEAAHGLEWTLRSQRLDQFQERPLTLRSHDEVDIRRPQNGVGVLGWEITTPYDRHIWQRGTNCFTDRDRLTELRP